MHFIEKAVNLHIFLTQKINSFPDVIYVCSFMENFNVWICNYSEMPTLFLKQISSIDNNVFFLTLLGYIIEKKTKTKYWIVVKGMHVFFTGFLYSLKRVFGKVMIVTAFDQFLEVLFFSESSVKLLKICVNNRA